MVTIIALRGQFVSQAELWKNSARQEQTHVKAIVWLHFQTAMVA